MHSGLRIFLCDDAECWQSRIDCPDVPCWPKRLRLYTSCRRALILLPSRGTGCQAVNKWATAMSAKVRSASSPCSRSLPCENTPLRLFYEVVKKRSDSSNVSRADWANRFDVQLDCLDMWISGHQLTGEPGCLEEMGGQHTPAALFCLTISDDSNPNLLSSQAHPLLTCWGSN